MDLPAALLAAVALVREGRHREAETALRAILRAEPEQPNALFLLGESALAAGRPNEAIQPFDRNLQLRPTHRDGRVALARAQLAAGQPVSAFSTLEPLAAEARLAAVHTLRGTALSMMRRPAEAAEAFRAALAANPSDAEAELNLGNTFETMDQPEQAEHHIRRALAIQPTLAEAHASLGHVLTVLGRPERAAAACRKAIHLRPDFAAAHWNLGVALLLAGDMRAGWEEYEWRKRRFPDSFPALPTPQWEGETSAGLRLLVLAEQGLGDAIQFARYLPMLAEQGVRVTIACAPGLVPLLSRLPGVQAVPRVEPLPAHDAWVDQMSLPRLFLTDARTVPAASGYLTPDGVRASAWDRSMPSGGLRVGLVWAGNPAHSNDRRRSMPATTLAPLLSVPGCTFVSLQLGPHAGELPTALDAAAGLTDWGETAAAVTALDLVITVDTAVAHLAGALGIPTWVMLPAAPDWRWMLGREDTPWYTAMRLFRQGTIGDWEGVVRRVATALAESATQAGAP